MAGEAEPGTLDDSGQSEIQIDQSQSIEENWDGMKTLDEIEGESGKDKEEESGEQSNEQGEQGEQDEEQDYSGLDKITDESYKSMEKYISKTRDEMRELEQTNQSIESALAPYGGMEKALNLVKYVSTDPEFAQLIAKKSRGESSIDESKMSPDAKEAMKIVRDVAKEEVAREIALLKQNTIDPHFKATNDRNLDALAEQMTDKFGDDWLKYADDMQKLAEDYSEQKRNNMTIKDVEGLYVRALNDAGELDKFSVSKRKQKEQKKIEKSTPRTRTTNVDSEKPQGKPRDLFEAAKRAAKKHNIQF